MFPYLDFAVVAFVLFAGFGLGLLLGGFLRERGRRVTFDGDGGEPVPVSTVAELGADRGPLAQVIPFPTRKAS